MAPSKEGRSHDKDMRFSPSALERAVRLMGHLELHCESLWVAIASVAARMGCPGETLQMWLRQGELDVGKRPGLTSDDLARVQTQ